MAKKTKKTKYSKGWETRRRNAAKLGVSPHRFKKKVSAAPIMSRRARHAAMLDQGMHAGNTDAKFDPPAAPKMTDGATPGHGEIVGGADAKLAERIATLARKKGGIDEIQTMLALTRAAALYEGRAEADQRATKTLVHVQQVIADRIVCGFIAEVESSMKYYSGLPPQMTWQLSSFTLTKIVDALNDAGYTSRGRKSQAASLDAITGA